MNGKALLVVMALSLVAAVAAEDAEEFPGQQQPQQPQQSQQPQQQQQQQQQLQHQQQQQQQHHGPPPLPRPAVRAGPRKFTCVFFPGVGIDWPQLDVDEPLRARHPKFLRRSYPAYWGDRLHSKLHGKCEELFFYDTDTSYRGWNDNSLAREFSRVIDQQKPHVVFAHGMGNLVLANCKHQNLAGCKDLGKKVDWFALAPMLRGTEVAEVMEPLCPKLVGSEVFKDGVDCVSTTPGSPLPPSQQKYALADAWKSLMPALVPKWVYKTAENDLSGEMCGFAATDYAQQPTVADEKGFGVLAKAMSQHNPKGLNSRTRKHRPDPDDWKARNLVTARQTPKYGNDGVVALSSCAVRATSKYKKDAKSKWYALDADHDFATCSSGDTNFPSQQPCEWIINMVDKVRKQNKFPSRFVEISTSADAADEEEAEEEADAETEAEEEDEVEAEEAEEQDEAEAEEETEDADEIDA